LLSQRRKAFTSVGLLIAALFGPIVAKKPHIPLKSCTFSGRRQDPDGGLPVRLAGPYIGGEPFSGDINDIQGHREV
jgi:hypothetical protein